jgi:hypothetical protein
MDSQLRSIPDLLDTTVDKWARLYGCVDDHLVTLGVESLKGLLTMVSQWGADRELEAIAAWLKDNCYECSYPDSKDYIMDVRRPKPTLKQRALEALERADGADYPSVITALTADQHALIREALESIPDPD